MSTIVLRGTLQELQMQLQKMQQLVHTCVDEGFDPALPEFVYQYVSAGDACEECLFLDGSRFSGSVLLFEFPYAEQISSEVWRANMHPNCRCLLMLINVSEACTTLLTEELSIL